MKGRTETTDLNALAEYLARAWISRTVAETLPPVLLTSRSEGYAVQDMMAGRIGDHVAGWKAGATSNGMRARDGHDDIVPGRIFAKDLYLGDKHILAAADFPETHLEPEFAFRINRPLPLRSQKWTAPELADDVTSHIAIEIIGSRMSSKLSAACRHPAMTIADNGNGVALVIGAEIPPDVVYDPMTLPVRMTINSGPPAQNSPPDIRAQPLDALVDTVNLLAGRGIAVEQGQYITTGSATATLPVTAGATALADFGPLGCITLTFKP